MPAQPNRWNDQLSIDTPELVSLDLPLAGIGSRCLALLIDYALQLGILILVLLLFSGLAAAGVRPAASHNNALASGDKWAIAILILIPFIFHWGYFALFEAFWNGRTPGKRSVRIRVIHQSGRNITFFEALNRNLVRVIDALPSIYAVGVATIFITRRNQRLGDLTAGTLVIHEAHQEASHLNGSGTRSITAFVFDAEPMRQTFTPTGLPADALARLDPSDLETIDNFLARRLDLPIDIRKMLAARLAAQMKSRMHLTEPLSLSDETLLEGIERDARTR